LQSLHGDETEAPAAAPAAEAKPAPSNQFRSQADETLVEALKQAREQSPVYHAMFRLHEECVMKYARAFMAVSAIQESSEILACIPDAEKLEEEEFELEFELFFQGETKLEDLRKQIDSLSEIQWYEVSEWDPDAKPETDPEGTDQELKLVEVKPAESAPKEAEATAAPPAGGPRKSEAGQTVRVDVARLDNLMNLVGELVIDRTRIAQIGSDLSNKFNDQNVDALEETVGHIARITGDLQDQIMKARMMPIETVFNRFPRVVRDLANKLGKEIKLELEGGETELDRSVIEVIGDPLLHILRNSVDHGVEMPDDREKNGKPRTGRIVVSAKHQENHIVIEIVDDGGGIDVERIRKKAVESGLVSSDTAERMSDKEALQLIFASGLSTASEVSEVSGRGVGMDIVRSNIQKLGGIIDLDSEIGTGTRFQLRLPLTLAIIRGLLVESSEEVYVLPLTSVVETLNINKSQIQTINGHEVIVIRGLTTPILRMKSLFPPKNLPIEEKEQKDEFVVVVGLAEQRVGIVVDQLIGEQEVVIKSISRFCGDIDGVSGATILGDGNVALIVDVNGVVPTERV
jgi:two-component system chemotaxis sensor kinase CheA